MYNEQLEVYLINSFEQQDKIGSLTNLKNMQENLL